MGEPTGRRERKREQTRRAIADAAMRLFAERGFDKVTVAEVAEAADVSVNTVFNHFPTKEDLFFGSQETPDDGLVRSLSARGPSEPVVAALRRYFAEAIERYREIPRERCDIESRAAIRQILMGSPALQVRALQDARRRARAAPEALAAALASNPPGAEPDDLMPRLIAAQILSLHSTLFLQAEERRRAGQDIGEICESLERAAEAGLALLERGLGDFGARRV